MTKIKKKSHFDFGREWASENTLKTTRDCHKSNVRQLNLNTLISASAVKNNLAPCRFIFLKSSVSDVDFLFSACLGSNSNSTTA